MAHDRRSASTPLFSLDEVVAARDAGRGLGGLLKRLRGGEATRFVILFRGRPQAVLLHVDEYRELLRRAHAGGGERAA